MSLLINIIDRWKNIHICTSKDACLHITNTTQAALSRKGVFRPIRMKSLHERLEFVIIINALNNSILKALIREEWSRFTRIAIFFIFREKYCDDHNFRLDYSLKSTNGLPYTTSLHQHQFFLQENLRIALHRQNPSCEILSSHHS